MQISVNGSATTPVASGPDAVFISSVVDNGTGSYTINFKESAKTAPFVSGLVVVGSKAVGEVVAVTTSSITVSFVDMDDAAADADFNIQWQYSDQLNYYF